MGVVKFIFNANMLNRVMFSLGNLMVLCYFLALMFGNIADNHSGVLLNKNE